LFLQSITYDEQLGLFLRSITYDDGAQEEGEVGEYCYVAVTEKQ